MSDLNYTSEAARELALKALLTLAKRDPSAPPPPGPPTPNTMQSCLLGEGVLEAAIEVQGSPHSFYPPVPTWFLRCSEFVSALFRLCSDVVLTLLRLCSGFVPTCSYDLSAGLIVMNLTCASSGSRSVAAF